MSGLKCFSGGLRGCCTSQSPGKSPESSDSSLPACWGLVWGGSPKPSSTSCGEEALSWLSLSLQSPQCPWASRGWDAQVINPWG